MAAVGRAAGGKAEAEAVAAELEWAASVAAVAAVAAAGAVVGERAAAREAPVEVARVVPPKALV